jgi:hypothetical protein
LLVKRIFGFFFAFISSFKIAVFSNSPLVLFYFWGLPLSLWLCSRSKIVVNYISKLNLVVLLPVMKKKIRDLELVQMGGFSNWALCNWTLCNWTLCNWTCRNIVFTYICGSNVLLCFGSGPRFNQYFSFGAHPDMALSQSTCHHTMAKQRTLAR